MEHHCAVLFIRCVDPQRNTKGFEPAKTPDIQLDRIVTAQTNRCAVPARDRLIGTLIVHVFEMEIGDAARYVRQLAVRADILVLGLLHRLLIRVVVRFHVRLFRGY